MSVYARDRAPWLELALDSVASQTLPPAQIVVVLDGPVGPELHGALDRFEHGHPGLLTRVPLERNQGLGRALQAGLPRCEHGVVARMDADDISLPERLERQIEKIAEGFDMVGCNVSEFSHDPARPNALRVMPETEGDIVRFGKRRAPFVHSAFVACREAIERVGGYRDVPYAEDYDLFIRLIEAGCRGCNIQEPLMAIRVDDDAYRRRGGLSYLRDMLAFNRLELREGWFGPIDFLVRSAANAGVALLPNGLRDLVYKRLLRRRS